VLVVVVVWCPALLVSDPQSLVDHPASVLITSLVEIGASGARPAIPAELSLLLLWVFAPDLSMPVSTVLLVV
jgi:hypothetical protein